MKLFFAAAIAFFSATATLHAQTELPDTQIKDLATGKKIAFNETVEKGKVTLISFWATWCIPCKNEIQNIREKMPQWKQEADFNFITISMDGARNEGIARTYTKTKRWDFPTYIDPNSDLNRSLNFQNVPFTIVVDKDGKIVYRRSGAQEGSEDEIFAKVKEYSAAK